MTLITVNILNETRDRDEAERLRGTWLTMLSVVALDIETQHGLAVAEMVEILVIQSPRAAGAYQVVMAKTEDANAEAVAAVYIALRKRSRVVTAPRQGAPYPAAGGRNHGRSYLSGSARKWSAGDAYH